MPFGPQFGAGQKLEADYAPSYELWKRNPDRNNTTKLIQQLNPTIDKAIRTHVGPPNPLLRSRARKLTLQAIRSYDPAKSQLNTHITNQLQGLKRVARQQNQVLALPERVTLDQAHLAGIEAELNEDLGRMPSMAELADRSGLSSKRIQHVRRFRQPLAEGQFNRVDEEGSGDSAPGVRQAPSTAWHELVYGDLDPINQTIMEYTIGLHGQKRLSNMELARKLGMTPGAVSQRKASIQKLLDQQDLSPF